MTTRRSFLGSILAAATPPGFVRAGVLMPVAPLVVMSHDQKIKLLDEMSAYLDEVDRLAGLQLVNVEPIARRESAEWAARRNDSILHQYMTGSYKLGFR